MRVRVLVIAQIYLFSPKQSLTKQFMKRLIYALILALPSLTTAAQQVTISWGEESKKELQFRSFVPDNSNGMIKLCFDIKTAFLKAPTITPVLTRFSNSLAQLNERSIEVDDKNISFNDLLSVKGKLFLFSNQYDKDAKTTTYYCQPLNIQTLDPVGQLINLGAFDAVRKTSQTSVGYTFSKDSTKILMFGQAPFKKGDNEKYYICVLDNNMKKLWDKTIELPYLDKFVTFEESLITNDGKVGVLIKHYDQDVTKEAVKVDGVKVPSYKEKLLIYDKDNANPVEYVLDLGDKFIHSLQLVDDNKSNLVVFGLYQDKLSGSFFLHSTTQVVNDGYITGFFTATFDKNSNKVTTANINPFPADLVSQVKIDKQGSDKEKDPGLHSAFALADVEERENGSKDFILEYSGEVYVPGSYSYVNGSYVYIPGYWLYNYGDIIDVNLGKDSKVVIGRIPKMQVSRDIRYFSNFKAVPYKNKLLVFYNDDEKNIERDIAKKPDDVTNFSKSVFVMGTFDEQDNVTRTSLFNNKDNNKLTVAVRESMLIGKNRIGLYAQKLGGLFSTAKDMVGILDIK
jgi:hypothetical protein